MATQQLLTDDMRRKLVEAREAKGWAQMDLAAVLQTSQTHISKWETGRRIPTLAGLSKWCTGVGLKLKVEIE